MDHESLISELQGYVDTLDRIILRFVRTRDSLTIGSGDHAKLKQIVLEMVDLFKDIFGPNQYSSNLIKTYNDGLANFLGSPSYSSVESIRSTVNAAITRVRRNPALVEAGKAAKSRLVKENIFIIHGHAEAKWREAKDIVQNKFGLNPIVLMELPNGGCRTLIEKFEHYAETCTAAVAVFTPDDEIEKEGLKYLQARPNVIWELGWFCGKIGRQNTFLLLQNGTTIFSDFDGVIQKRFSRNISEIESDLRTEFISAGLLKS